MQGSGWRAAYTVLETCRTSLSLSHFLPQYFSDYEGQAGDFHHCSGAQFGRKLARASRGGLLLCAARCKRAFLDAKAGELQCTLKKMT